MAAIAVANRRLLCTNEDFQQAAGKRCRRNLSDATLQWYFPAWWRKKRLVLFSRNAFSQAAQGAGFACKKSFHLPEETGRHPATYCRTRAGELLGRDGFQTADIISSVHHCIAVDVWEATAFGTHLPRHWCWVTRNGMWAVSEGRKRRCQKSTKNTSPI